MQVEIDPEPSAEERAAILAAIERLEKEPAISAWWQTAVRENVESDEE